MSDEVTGRFYAADDAREQLSCPLNLFKVLTQLKGSVHQLTRLRNVILQPTNISLNLEQIMLSSSVELRDSLPHFLVQVIFQLLYPVCLLNGKSLSVSFQNSQRILLLHELCSFPSVQSRHPFLNLTQLNLHLPDHIRNRH